MIVTNEQIAKHLHEKHAFTASQRDMVEGYFDGRIADNPEPSENRSHCYRHGFANGRDDLRGKPRASGQEIREMAELAIKADGYEE